MNTFTTTPASSPETPETLVDRALGPKKVTTDEGSVEERSLKEIIQAEQYEAAKAVEGPLHGLRISRCKPGGAV